MSLVPAFFGKLGNAASEIFKPKKTLNYNLNYQFEHKHKSGDVTWKVNSTTRSDEPAPNADHGKVGPAVTSVVNSVKGEYKGKDFTFESEAKTSNTLSAKIETKSLLEGLKATFEAKFNAPKVKKTDDGLKTSRTTSANVKFAYGRDNFAGDAKFDLTADKKFTGTVTGVVAYEGLALGGEIELVRESEAEGIGDVKKANFAVDYKYNDETSLTLKSATNSKKKEPEFASTLTPSFHYRVNPDTEVAFQLDIPVGSEGDYNGRFGGAYRIDADSLLKGNIAVTGGKKTVINTAYSHVLSSRAQVSVSSQLNAEDLFSGNGQPHRLGFKLSLGDF